MVGIVTNSNADGPRPCMNSFSTLGNYRNGETRRLIALLLISPRNTVVATNRICVALDLMK